MKPVRAVVAGGDVARSAPDGYSVFFATSTQISALPSLRKNAPFDPLDLTSQTLPDLPTMSEADMPPFPAVPFMGLFNPLSSEAMGALAKEQTDVWRRLTREAGIVAE